jgi:predicted RNA binding protein YcfA (HicA-like mRNA interferase family)
MGQRKYPPLTPGEIKEILVARGFNFHHSKGDHNYYVHDVRGRKHIAQVDSKCPIYDDTLIKMVLKETGLTREQFYCSTNSTAKKINLKCASDEELVNWALA